MTTLVTGAGLIGSLVAARLQDDHNDHVVLYDVAFKREELEKTLPLERVALVPGDVTDVAELIAAFQEHEVERVVHTAAFLTTTVRDRPHAGVAINLGGTQAVLEAARLTGVKRVVFCSSASVYFGLNSTPSSGVLEEDLALRLVSERPPSVYATAKLAAEWLGHHYETEFGVEFIALRIGGVFGPTRGTPSGGPTRLMQALVESAHRAEPVRLRKADLQGGAIDYVYALDVAQAASRAVHAADPSSRVYNVSEGVARRVPQIIEIVEGAVGRPLELDVVDEGGAQIAYSVDSVALDLTRARRELGYEVEFPMARAVDDYLAWLGQAHN